MIHNQNTAGESEEKAAPVRSSNGLASTNALCPHRHVTSIDLTPCDRMLPMVIGGPV